MRRGIAAGPVGQRLAERGVSIIRAIAITRALLGNAETPLRVAIDIVATSTATFDRAVSRSPGASWPCSRHQASQDKTAARRAFQVLTASVPHSRGDHRR
ncbi:hypothetical protein CG719_33655 [Streptomyces sp. CB01373]|nr:hypothetical protein CG719_33655 [Streptomyces sp. CB01373]